MSGLLRVRARDGEPLSGIGPVRPSRHGKGRPAHHLYELVDAVVTPKSDRGMLAPRVGGVHHRAGGIEIPQIPRVGFPNPHSSPRTGRVSLGVLEPRPHTFPTLSAIAANISSATQLFIDRYQMVTLSRRQLHLAVGDELGGLTSM
jgi:hypothetical protein